MFHDLFLIHFLDSAQCKLINSIFMMINFLRKLLKYTFSVCQEKLKTGKMERWLRKNKPF